MTVGETWLDIAGYEGLYQVSNLGRVKSLDRLRHTGYGYHSVVKGRILKLQKKQNGYLYAVLVKPGFNGSHKPVHRLVLKAFQPRLDANEFQVNHLNGSKTDNRLPNLEWCTASENSTHAYQVLGVGNIRKR